MRGFGALLVATLLSGAGVAAAVQGPYALTAPTVAAVPPTLPPDLPRLTAAYDAPATLTHVAESAAPAGAPALVWVADGDDEVPARALEAYQRAAAVIGQADPSCQLAWPLLAAIGRVESDHGRTGGSRLAPDGKDQPAVLGLPLDGRRGTARVIDTDHGSLDGDGGVDRALGPMQFLPATWAAVAVDADVDGRRDPQDIDDAALAAAVFLCAGHDDLATDTGQRAAVLRYNHSKSYVPVVLATMTRYADAYEHIRVRPAAGRYRAGDDAGRRAVRGRAGRPGNCGRALGQHMERRGGPNLVRRSAAPDTDADTLGHPDADTLGHPVGHPVAHFVAHFVAHSVAHSVGYPVGYPVGHRTIRRHHSRAPRATTGRPGRPDAG